MLLRHSANWLAGRARVREQRTGVDAELRTYMRAFAAPVVSAAAVGAALLVALSLA